MEFWKSYMSRAFFCIVLIFGIAGCDDDGDSGVGDSGNSAVIDNNSEDYQGNWTGNASQTAVAHLVNPPSTTINQTEIQFEITGDNIEGEWVMWSGTIGICDPTDPNYWSNPACTDPLKPVLWANFEGTCTFSYDRMSCKVDNEEWNESTDITGYLNDDSSLSVEFFSPGQSEPFMTADSLIKGSQT